ncbi:MAG: hypothetical protein CVV25_07840 [Ignavibacteriae bacterium HGW-Ignavibacteriae-4]|jgi:hypothetical protein|nr:MAG: hypothetical protein CVV25_07840 [Ignavibacteriae bacterium HGW-Ignavibacteriae-4]
MKDDSKYIYNDNEAFEDLLIISKLFYWLNAIIFLIELLKVCAGLFGFENLVNVGSVIILLFFLFIFSFLFLLIITLNRRVTFILLLKHFVIQIITIAPFIWAFSQIKI